MLQLIVKIMSFHTYVKHFCFSPLEIWPKALVKYFKMWREKKSFSAVETSHIEDSTLVFFSKQSSFLQLINICKKWIDSKCIKIAIVNYLHWILCFTIWVKRSTYIFGRGCQGCWYRSTETDSHQLRNLLKK